MDLFSIPSPRARMILTLVAIWFVSAATYLVLGDSPAYKSAVSGFLKSEGFHVGIWVVIISVVSTCVLFDKSKSGFSKATTLFWSIGTYGLALTTSLKMTSLIYDTAVLGMKGLLPTFEQLDLFTLLAMVVAIIALALKELALMWSKTYNMIGVKGRSMERVITAVGVNTQAA